MTQGREEFHTAVRGSNGAWPSPPEWWSYSSLREAEECPRRWMLSRATYPHVWAGHGYPPRPILPALVGDVVHQALEIILRALYQHGCASLADASAVAALRAIGGYTTVIEDAIDARLRRIEGNPRAAHDLGALRSALLARVPDMRQRVQTTIARTSLIPRRTPAVGSAAGTSRARLAFGSHPETWLRAAELRFTGRVDLLSVGDDGAVITDYKTGSPDKHHIDQVKTYAVLWMRDEELNPDHLPVTTLVLSYATHDEVLEAPAAHETNVLASDLARRISEAERELERRPPRARPSTDLCGFCSVRHLCEDFWSSPSTLDMRTPGNRRGGEFVDCAGTVVSQNGPRSWVLDLEPSHSSLLLRTATETPEFRAGDRVRLLGVVVDRDDESGSVALGTIQHSEAFVLDSDQTV